MQKSLNYEIVIIGAGASGLMLASLLQINPQKICIIEAREKIGTKILVSGGGKCNITNKYLDASKYLGDEEFIKETLKNFGTKELLNFLKIHGLDTKIDERLVKGAYFCESSKKVLSCFSRLTEKIKLFLNTSVEDISYQDEKYHIKNSKNLDIRANKLIIASGSNAHFKDKDYEILTKISYKFRLDIKPFVPALVGLGLQKEQAWFKNLSGISLFAKLKINNKILEGKLLFTHRGFSGPLILNASLYWSKGFLEFDFLPKYILSEFYKKQMLISKALPLPRRFLQEFLLSIGLEDKPLNKLNLEEKQKLENLKSYTFAPAGNLGSLKAEVSKGGLNPKELDFNFECKTQKNLFFLGEALDITGQLGGYNLHFAFASAFKCSIFLSNILIKE